ncbi:PspC domain-containing protein [Pedobacter sp.]|uniref:PspC domain-containing protein n=1 Tax=Pedobacter sp. TaxID=1411316 RepID=UPI003D7F6942
MEKRLFRNEHDKVIAGVSSGVAAYMEVDVTIIRLLFVLSTIFLMGTGILVYLVMWIVVPVNPNPGAQYNKFNDFFNQQKSSATFNEPGAFTQSEKTTYSSGQDWSSSTFNEGAFSKPPQPDYSFIKKNSDTGRTIGGLFLLVIGLYFLMNEFNIIPYWFSLGKLWPLIFVAIGISFVAKSKRKDPWADWQNPQNPQTPPPPPAPTPGPQSPVDIQDANTTTTSGQNTPQP